MTRSYVCPCGHRQPYPDADPGRPCPACGRAPAAPKPRPQPAESTWAVVGGETAIGQAEAAGVLRPGQGSVVLARSRGQVETDLSVVAEVGCWHCRGTVGVTGRVFGRAGLGGGLGSAACPRCHATVSLEYALLAHPDRAELLVCAPSQVRGRSASAPSHCPALSVSRVTPCSPTPAAEKDHLRALLATASRRALKGKDAKLEPALAELVQARMSPGQTRGVCQWLRRLAEEPMEPFCLVALAEALLCLQDRGAGETLARAAVGALQDAGGGVAPGVLVHLALLPLLFGRRGPFDELVRLDRIDPAEETRGRHFRQRLTWGDVVAMVNQGKAVASYESTLGGGNWRQVYSLYAAFADDTREVPQTLGKRVRRLFASARQGKATAEGTKGLLSGKAFMRVLAGQFGDDRVDSVWVKATDEHGARSDYQQLLAAAERGGAGRGVLLICGLLADPMETYWIVGLVCRHERGEEVLSWFDGRLKRFTHRTEENTYSARDCSPESPGWPGELSSVIGAHWLGD